MKHIFTNLLRNNIKNFHKLPFNEQRNLIEKRSSEHIMKYLFEKSKSVYGTLDYFSSIGVEKVIILNDNDQSEINKIIALSFNQPHRLVNVERFKEDIFKDFSKEAKKKYHIPIELTDLITSINLKNGKGYSNIYFNINFLERS